MNNTNDPLILKILDKLFFIKIGDDESYACDSFAGLPLVMPFAYSLMLMLFLRSTMDIAQVSVIIVTWFYFLNQTYWHFRITNKVHLKQITIKKQIYDAIMPKQPTQ